MSQYPATNTGPQQQQELPTGSLPLWSPHKTLGFDSLPPLQALHVLRVQANPEQFEPIEPIHQGMDARHSFVLPKGCRSITI